MHRCLRDWGLHESERMSGLLEDGKVKGTKARDPDWSNVWLQRPLAAEDLRYAASDVLILREIYEQFQCMQAYDEALKASLQQASERYAAYFALHGATLPSKDDRFAKHALLPLGILLDETPMFPDAHQVECHGCRRKHAQNYFGGKTLKYCSVCAAISMRHKPRKLVTTQ